MRSLVSSRGNGWGRRSGGFGAWAATRPPMAITITDVAITCAGASFRVQCIRASLRQPESKGILPLSPVRSSLKNEGLDSEEGSYGLLGKDKGIHCPGGRDCNGQINPADGGFRAGTKHRSSGIGQHSVEPLINSSFQVLLHRFYTNDHWRRPSCRDGSSLMG